MDPGELRRRHIHSLHEKIRVVQILSLISLSMVIAKSKLSSPTNVLAHSQIHKSYPINHISYGPPHTTLLLWIILNE